MFSGENDLYLLPIQMLYKLGKLENQHFRKCLMLHLLLFGSRLLLELRITG